MAIDTLCVQAGYTPKNGEPRVMPIVQSTTYKYDSSVEMGKLFLPLPMPEQALSV